MKNAVKILILHFSFFIKNDLSHFIYKYALAFEQEGIEIGDVDALLGQWSQRLSSTSWFIIKFDDIHLSQVDGHTGIGENEVCLIGVVTNDAIDGIVHSVGNGGCNNLNASTFKLSTRKMVPDLSSKNIESCFMK